MRQLLTIAKAEGLDIYAVDGRSLLKHWFMDALDIITYKDIIDSVCDQLSWKTYELHDVVCVLPSSETSGADRYFAGAEPIDVKDLALSLGCEGGAILIETRSEFLSIKNSCCDIWHKDDIYNEAARLLTDFADMKFRSIGCRPMREGTLSYDHTKRFFLNLIEQMPETFEVLFVPVFASSGSAPLLSDRGFVEILMKDKVSEKTLSQAFDELLMGSLLHEDHQLDMALVYNDYLKRKLFI